jgi:hypothetical protein
LLNIRKCPKDKEEKNIMLTVPHVEGDEDENDHTLDFYDESDENLDIYTELNPYLLGGGLSASLQQMTTMPDVEMQEAPEFVNDGEGPSEDGRLAVNPFVATSFIELVNPKLLRPLVEDRQGAEPKSNNETLTSSFGSQSLVPVETTEPFINSAHSASVNESPYSNSHVELPLQSVTSVSTTSVTDPHLPFFTSFHRHYQHAKTNESPFERSAKKPATTINEENYIYIRTLMPVAQEDISKIEQVGTGKAKFIDDEHVMTYAAFLQYAKIIRSDTQRKMNLSRSKKREIYCRDGHLFLMGLGEEIEVKTCPIKRPAEKPATTNEKYYVYVRTLKPVAQADISKIEKIGQARFIGDENVVTYLSFLQHGEIIRSDTQGKMNLLSSEKKKIYPRDGRLFLRMNSGNEIQVETRPFKRPTEKPVTTINEENYYVYVRTLMRVTQADISKIEKIGKVKFIDDEHVMTYGSFLRMADIVRSDTQAVMNLLPSKKKKIYPRDGRLFLLNSGEEIEVETRPFKRADKKRKQEDITKHNEPEEDTTDATPAAKRKKMGEKAPITTMNRNKNRFFQKKINISDDKNRNTENEDDYNMGEPQDGPR